MGARGECTRTCEGGTVHKYSSLHLLISFQSPGISFSCMSTVKSLLYGFGFRDQRPDPASVCGVVN